MRYALATSALLLAVCGQPTYTHAQNSSEDVTAFFAEDVVLQDQLRRSRSELQIQAMEMRRALDEALNFGDMSSLKTMRRTLDPAFGEQFPGLVSIADTFEAANLPDGLDREALQTALTNFDYKGDWYASVYANRVLSMLHSRRMELLLAGQYTQDALDAIPETLSPLVSDAQLIIAEQVIVLYTISANPERMLEASKTTRQLNAELGAHFDRHELMTNFLLAFNRKRDHQGALAIADMIKAEESVTETHSVLAKVYKADLYNEIGDYQTAIDTAKMAETAADPFIQRRAIGEQMIALAGLGRRGETIQKMEALGFWENGMPTVSAFQSEGGLHTLALLSASEGDAAQAVAFMNQRVDLMISRLRAINANDTASLLSHLENSRERQQEREEALQREAEMRAVQLAQQKRVNRLLWAVLALLLSAFIGAIFFYRYREKNNVRLADLREQALSAEKMKTEFLGVVNHELRTPLNGVIGISDALIHHSPDAQTRLQAKTIQECGEQLQDLIESMIDMSTIDAGKLTLLPEPIALGPILEAEAKNWIEAATDKGLRYTHFIAPELDQAVDVDTQRLRQCVKILLSNAMRFTHEGRIHLHVTAQKTEAETLAITAIVADTGQGISEVVQDRLFKPFLQADSTMTRKYGGAGLSLAIARQLARMMGGDVTVVSSEGRGSEFTLKVDLPLSIHQDEAASAQTLETTVATPMAEDEDRPNILDLTHAVNATPTALDGEREIAQTPINPTDVHEDQYDEDIVDLLARVPEIFATTPAPVSHGITKTDPDDLNGLRVLIVEDLPSNLDVIRLMLEPEGCICVSALTAQEGLDYLAHHKVDVILMDIRMPGIDGVEATRLIRNSETEVSDLPLIVLTAQASADVNAQAVEAGADLFLTKPVIGRDLIEAIRFVRREKNVTEEKTA